MIPDDLRERLNRAAWYANVETQEHAAHIVTAVLGELDQAGYRIVAVPQRSPLTDDPCPLCGRRMTEEERHYYQRCELCELELMAILEHEDTVQSAEAAVVRPDPAEDALGYDQALAWIERGARR